jgi:hypothetical protein
VCPRRTLPAAIHADSFNRPIDERTPFSHTTPLQHTAATVADSEKIVTRRLGLSQTTLGKVVPLVLQDTCDPITRERDVNDLGGKFYENMWKIL